MTSDIYRCIEGGILLMLGLGISIRVLIKGIPSLLKETPYVPGIVMGPFALVLIFFGLLILGVSPSLSVGMVFLVLLFILFIIVCITFWYEPPNKFTDQIVYISLVILAIFTLIFVIWYNFKTDTTLWEWMKKY